MTGNVSKAKGLTPADVVMKTDVTNSVSSVESNPVSSKGVASALASPVFAATPNPDGHAGLMPPTDKTKLDQITGVSTSVTASDTNVVTGGAVHTAIRSSAYLAGSTKNGTVTADERAKVQALPTKETVSELPSGPIIEKNRYYDFGILDKDVTIILPMTGCSYGDIMQVDFVTGSTAYNVGISQYTSKHTAFSLTIAANTAYSIKFMWGPIKIESNAVVYGWRIKTETYSMT